MVYTADLYTGKAIQTGYEAAESENGVLADAAAILWRNIQASYNNSQTSPSTSTTASYLQSEAIVMNNSCHFVNPFSITNDQQQLF